MKDKLDKLVWYMKEEQTTSRFVLLTGDLALLAVIACLILH